MFSHVSVVHAAALNRAEALQWCERLWGAYANCSVASWRLCGLCRVFELDRLQASGLETRG